LTPYSKSFCKVSKGLIKHSHHALPVFLGNSRSGGVRVDIFEAWHRQVHQLLHYVLRFKGYPGGNKKTYQALGSNASYKDVFNALMDVAEYYDTVCLSENGGKSLRSAIWEDLYKGK